MHDNKSMISTNPLIRAFSIFSILIVGLFMWQTSRLTQEQNVNIELENEVSDLQATLVGFQSQQVEASTTTQALFPPLGGGHLGVETLTKDQTRLVNPFFKYQVTFAANRYNINATSWAEVTITDPANKGAFLHIRATKSKEFPDTLYDAAGYPTDKTCTKSTTTIAGVTATKYVCQDLLDDFYLLDHDSIHYSIRTNNEAPYKAETETLLKGFEFN